MKIDEEKESKGENYCIMENEEWNIKILKENI